MHDVLDFNDIEDLVKRVTYKPNVQFDVLHDHSSSAGDVRIRAKIWTLNSRETYPPADRWTALTVNGLGVTGVRDIAWMQNDGSRLLCSIVPIGITHTQIVPWPVRENGERLFWTWFRHAMIDGLEHHEAREWFRVDGELVDDPHKEGIFG